jgi:hypothetical protein
MRPPASCLFLLPDHLMNFDISYAELKLQDVRQISLSQPFLAPTHVYYINVFVKPLL